MPTYEYQCKRCEAVYDLQESFSAPTTHRCKECKRGTAKRVLHAPRIVFKGSGFYVTDSKSRESATSDADAPKEKKGDAGGSKPPESGATTGGGTESTASAAS